MKRLLVLTTAALIAWASVAAAQPGQGDDNNCPMGRDRTEMRMHRMHPGGQGMGMRGEGKMGPRMLMHRGMAGAQGMGLQRLLALADELELTEEQRDKIRSMSVAFRTEKIDREAELKKARLRMMDLRMDEDASEAEVNEVIDDLARLRADMEKMQFQHRRAIQSILTDKQKDKLKELRMDRRGRMWDDDNDEDDESDDQTIPPYRPRRGRI